MLTVLVFAIYGQTANHEFINFDDDVYIYDNPHIESGLTLKNIQWAFTDAYGGNWHPLTWVSHMVDIQIFGKNPGAHHLINAGLHLINSCLLFFILRKATGCLWKSALVAVFFAVHPLRVESVAWAAERKDVLSAFFGFSAIGAYLSYVQKSNLLRYIWVAFLFVLSLLAKPMLVTLPILFIILDFWPLQRIFQGSNSSLNITNLRSKIFEKLPLLILVGFSSWVTFKAQFLGSSVKSLEEFPIWIRACNVFESYVAYVGKILWPQSLILFYPHSQETVDWLGGLLALGFLTAVTFWFFFNKNRYPYALVGWVWFLISLLPVIGLIQVGHQSMADRYTYIPSIGITLIFVWGAADFFEKRSKLLGIFLGSMVLLFLTFLAWAQAGRWQNNETIYEYVLQVDPNNLLALHNYSADLNQKAKGLANRGEFNEAYKKWEKAVQLDPQFALPKLDWGNTLAAQGKFEKAIDQYKLALKTQPDDSSTLANLGSILVRAGRFQEGLEKIDRALVIQPDFFEAFIYKAGVLTIKKDFLGAIDQYKQALVLNPSRPDIYNNLGGILLSIGNVSEATIAFRSAMEKAPSQPGFAFNLGRAYWVAGEKEKAVYLWENILKLKPNYEPAKLALAKAQIEKN
jgi:tetratricopeptide (TPR) repeat protein